MPLSLGDINFALGADTAALDKSLSKLQRFGLEVEKAARRQAEGSDRATAALKRQEKALTSALQKTLNLTAAVRRNEGGEKIALQAAKAFEVYNAKLTRTNVSALQFQRATTQFNAALGTTRRQLQDVIRNKTLNQFGDLTNLLKNIAGAAVLVSGPLGGIAARVTAFAAIVKRSNLAIAAFVGGIALAIVGLQNFGSAILDNARKLDIARGQFEAISASVTVSNLLFEESIAIARKSGQNITVVASQYAKFLAAAQGTGLQGEKSKRVFEAVSQVIGKLRLPAEQAEGVFKALEQIMSKGVVQAEELRGQLGDRLVGAFQIAARATGANTAELNKLIKQGKVVSEDFLPKFAEELKKTFNVDDSGVKGYQASINNLATSWSLFLDRIDSVLGISQSAQATFAGVAAALDYLGKNLEVVLKLAAALAGAMLALSAPAIIGGILTVAKAIRTAASAMAAFNAVILANPLGSLLTLLVRLLTLIAGAVAGWLLMDVALGDATKSTRELYGEVDEVIKSMGLMNGTIGTVDQTVRNKLIDSLHASSLELIDLKRQLDAINDDGAGGFLRRLNPFGDSAEDIKKKIAKIEEVLKNGRERLTKLDKTSTPTSTPISTTTSTPTDEQIQRRAEALAEAQQEMQRVIDSIDAISKGGQPGLEALNKQFEMQDKVDAYAKKLKDAGVSASEAALKTEAYKEAVQRLSDLQVEAARTQEIITSMQQTVASGFSRLGDAIGEMVSKGKIDLHSLASTFQEIASQILKQALQLSVVNPILNQIFGFSGSSLLPSIGGLFAANGGAFTNLRPQKMAAGGLITRPTLFSSAQGPVIGGEAGTEAIMPLKRTSSGELGVRLAGGSAPMINVTIQTPNPQAFRRSEGQIAALMRRAVVQGERTS